MPAPYSRAPHSRSRRDRFLVASRISRRTTEGESIMTNQQPAARGWAEEMPFLAELTDKFLFGQIWERPELSKRDRSMITVAVLTALYRTDQLRNHMIRALNNGVTED